MRRPHASQKLVLAILPAILAALFSLSCGGVEVPIDYTPTYGSLLLLQPLIGEETGFRDVRFETTRYSFENESIEGWVIPEEQIIRIPVYLEEGARLSTRLRLVLDIESIAGLIGGIIAIKKIDDKPDNPIEVLFQSQPEDINTLVQSWVDLDLDLSDHSGLYELVFGSQGPLAGKEDVNLFFGQPHIYYPEDNEHKNILLIGIDTMRRDACSIYGDDERTTPFVSELAESSTVFDRAWSQAPWTLPSFSSMLTGQYPSTIGATGYTEHLPGSALTAGEILRRYGYATQTVCGNPWIGADNSGFEQGMDSVWYTYDAPADESVENAKEFISRSDRQSWFCFLHFQGPHSDYTPPLEYAEKFSDPEYNGEFKSEFLEQNSWKLGDVEPSREDIEQIRNLYNAEVNFVDDSIRDLITWMEENGYLENTLVIYSADHGEEFYEHNRLGHGHGQYEEQVRAPLLVRGPGFPGNTRIDNTVSYLDILPTILAYAGIQIPDDLTGVPLQESLNEDVESERIVFGDECFEKAEKFAVEWPYKCILDFDTSDVSLFDLSTDPGEFNDLAGSDPELTDRLVQDIRTNVIPRDPVFMLVFVHSPDDAEINFTGTLTLPGGVDFIKTMVFSYHDVYSIEGNEITFDVGRDDENLAVVKKLVIYPSRFSYDMEVSIRVNGEDPGDRFFPFGTPDADPDGEATVKIAEFPWPALLPDNYDTRKTACYVIAVPGIDPEDDDGSDGYEMSSETEEQLKAIGYLN